MAQGSRVRNRWTSVVSWLASLVVLAATVAPATAGAAEVPSGPDTLSVERLYLAYFEREPDPDGLDYWKDVRDQGVPLVVISQSFAESQELVERQGDLDDGSFVRFAYDQVLGRAPEPAGFEFWLGKLAQGQSRGAVMLGFSDSAEFKVRTGLVGDPYRPPTLQLPQGGTTLFPRYRLVAEYGRPGVPVLGVLGEKGPAEAARQVDLRAGEYELHGDRSVLPTFEIIATLAQDVPGADGDYSAPMPPEEIRPWLEAVRTVDGYMILDLQPGRASFLDQARLFEPLLVEPDVGLALDPEWSVGSDGVPGGGTIGSVTAAEINEVSAYLAELVARAGLPEKALVVHRFTPGMVIDEEDVVSRPGVAVVFHADGFGTPEAKLADYRSLLPDRFARGLKLFLDEDSRLLASQEVMGISPPPDVITYQ